MRFLLDDEQREFARSLDKMLGGAEPTAAIRAWAAGDTGPGRALWARLAEAGVFALAVPEEHEGLGLLPVELAVSFGELGRHAVPGPLVETVAAAALLARLGGPVAAARLPGIASGRTAASLCLLSPGSPYALDGDAADAVFVVDGDTLRLAESTGPVQPSSDPARRLSRPVGGTVLRQGPEVVAAAAHAAEVAALAVAAQALGVGRALLAQTVEYVGGRKQFGVAIGSFQAVKHRLADTLIALEFAEPLVHAAALALAPGDPGSRSGFGSGRAVAAAKVAACEAAYAAARSALQLHGALGYTEELDLSLWIRKARALRTAWGTPAECRARVLAR
ncbi:acyl-CoA dehydrogenase family protein [Streptomyces luteolus]|uniref:Acyl-CoA dehydrogenase family protein n=1 Tax=Streptomyces luteolus TaxID=3043615 RepID=A0ABT6STW9_9ACTN|nr:acyl-CoA dehydrogenase family protein [Streptomyces sp. B-S-A12]MDI3419059.1 acyl-CoA dehydrogenase family protein [Streptomyces sp. B-S-A12]